MRIHIRVPACHINRVALQPAGGAGVILAGADMISTL